METLAGRDSSSIKDMITDETSNVDWARLLLDESTDDMIINVSREKIAHELIRLRTESKNQNKDANITNSYSRSNLSHSRGTARSTKQIMA